MRGRDGVVGAVGDGPAEVEAEPVLEGELVRAAPGVDLWRHTVVRDPGPQFNRLKNITKIITKIITKVQFDFFIVTF